MDRRNFLRLTGAASAGFALPGLSSTAFAQERGPDRWRMFEVTTQVEVIKPRGTTRVWLPTPLTQDARYEKSLGNHWTAEGGKIGFMEDPRYKAGIVWAEFPEGVRPQLTLVSRFATQNVAVDFSRRGDAPAEDAATLRQYTQATKLLPTDGVVKDTSSGIVRGIRGDVDKAHAIYEWIVDNTYRDPKTRGCGTGDIKFMLENNALGGKCADLNALFVALARAEGIPARDVYGIRVADSALGYKSLGKSGDITKAQHCRAEFYTAGYGWVPVDPADVRKVILEEGGGKKADDPMVLAARKRLFGSWEMNWLAYNYAQDLELPGSSRGVHFLMYPQSETAEGRLDELDPENFKYTISSKEIA
ncbi:MAG TPA: transglutaminase-like domain-containing protein [Usitatibacter sp.]|nr:transglutaminase-like domain-containing protein [Usitatibacter sp.]